MPTPATGEPLAAHWAATWPDTITLGEAAEEIDFDLFADDDPDQVLVKVLRPLTDVVGELRPTHVVQAEIDAAARNDAEDRFSRLEGGLLAGGEHVPPVIDAGMGDGYHRRLLAELHRIPMVPVYVEQD